MLAYTATVTDDVYDAVRDKCIANGLEYSKALRSGMMAFLEADHDEFIRLMQKYKDFGK